MQTVGTSCYTAELQVHELHQNKNYMLATYFCVKFTVEIHHMNYWYLTRGTTWSLRTATSHHGHQAHISVGPACTESLYSSHVSLSSYSTNRHTLSCSIHPRAIYTPSKNNTTYQDVQMLQHSIMKINKFSLARQLKCALSNAAQSAKYVGSLLFRLNFPRAPSSPLLVSNLIHSLASHICMASVYISDLNIQNDYFRRNIEIQNFKVKMAEAKEGGGEGAFVQFMSEVGPGVREIELGCIAASNKGANQTRRLVSLY